jgi:DNA polymerase-1
MPPILYLIDGHALAYRTYFALTAASSSGERWQTKSGEATAGVYGFASVLLRILEQERPDYLAVAFDTGRTFRDDIFKDYKGTREKMPDDLRAQMNRVRQLVDTFNIPRLEVEGYEADDVLGSVATSAARRGLGVKIITGDRDLLQLVTDRIVVNLAGGKLSEAKDYFPDDVVSLLGVRPDQVVDYKALVGDTSDNIPGVGGIGPKTALSLLQSYPTLIEIYQHLEEVKPKVRSLLENDRDNAFLSYKLAAIVIDLPVTLDMEKAQTANFDPQPVEELFRELEFRSLLPRLKNLTQATSNVPAALQQLSLFTAPEPRRVGIGVPSNQAVNPILVTSAKALSELSARLSAAPSLAFDTETTSTDPMRADLVGIALAVDGDTGYYIPVGHHAPEGSQLHLDQVLSALHDPLTNPDQPKIGHNLKYDALVLKRLGIDVNPLAFDTMIAEWLTNPASHNLGLKNLAWDRLGVEMIHIEELIGKGKNQVSMADVEIKTAGHYAAADAAITMRLVTQLKSELEQLNAAKLMDTVEMPLVGVLVDIEHSGVGLDGKFLAKMSAELASRMVDIEKSIYASAGTTFNLNSTQQLSNILFERLKLEPPDRRKRTTSGHFSTSVDVLDELRGQHVIIDKIMEYRELAKLKSTYIDTLPQQVNPITGRVHTSYNQTGSVTGRLASSEPNLQNIPTRTDLGRRVRQGFIAAPGNLLISVDYSQIELRIVAHMAQDEAMLASFRAGQDIHAATAAAIYNIPLASVSKEQRRHAKAINFGLIYGMSAFGLSRTTDLTLAEAEDFVRAYFQQFPGVKQFLDNTRRLAARQGYVETLLGRRRYFPGLSSQSNINIRNREEREAINAPIQGTAADIMKIAMLNVFTGLKQSGLHGMMILQVHDELVLECPQAELEKTVIVVQQAMENAYQLSIPLLTEARWGSNWGEMQVYNHA